MRASKERRSGTTTDTRFARLALRDFHHTDWPEVERIYAEGIATDIATFETKPKSQAQFEADAIDGSLCVATLSGRIAGWGALWPTSKRQCYWGVAEVSLYIDMAASGRGVGTAILTDLIARSESLGIWTLQSAIFAENTPSVALHRRCGFRTVGLRERIGERGGIWRDIHLMERRSTVVATASAKPEDPQ